MDFRQGPKQLDAGFEFENDKSVAYEIHRQQLVFLIEVKKRSYSIILSHFLLKRSAYKFRKVTYLFDFKRVH